MILIRLRRSLPAMAASTVFPASSSTENIPALNFSTTFPVTSILSSFGKRILSSWGIRNLQAGSVGVLENASGEPANYTFMVPRDPKRSKLLGSQGIHRRNPHRAARRNPAGEQRHHGERQRHANQRDRIGGRYAEKETGHQMSGSLRGRESHRHAGYGKDRAGTQSQQQNIAR